MRALARIARLPRAHPPFIRTRRRRRLFRDRRGARRPGSACAARLGEKSMHTTAMQRSWTMTMRRLLKRKTKSMMKMTTSLMKKGMGRSFRRDLGLGSFPRRVGLEAGASRVCNSSEVSSAARPRAPNTLVLLRQQQAHRYPRPPQHTHRASTAPSASASPRPNRPHHPPRTPPVRTCSAFTAWTTACAGTASGAA